MGGDPAISEPRVHLRFLYGGLVSRPCGLDFCWSERGLAAVCSEGGSTATGPVRAVFSFTGAPPCRLGGGGAVVTFCTSRGNAGDRVTCACAQGNRPCRHR